MGKLYYLDWDRDELFGWEKYKNDLVIDAIIRGIEAGDDFPPVSISRHKGRDGFYISADKFKWNGFFRRVREGGHNRAVGHYIVNEPLKCVILPGHPGLGASWYIPISQISITDDYGEYNIRKKRFPDYR